MSALYRRVMAHYQRAFAGAVLLMAVLAFGGAFLVEHLSGTPFPVREGMALTWWAFACWMVAVNTVTWVTWAADKRLARRSSSESVVRVPEGLLISLAVLGGLPAALLAMPLLRHKRRKRAFQFRLLVSVVAMAVAVVGLAHIAGRLTAA